MSMFIGRRATLTMASLALLLVGRSSAASIISEKQELAAGREADANLTKQYKVSTDPAANARVSGIEHRL